MTSNGSNLVQRAQVAFTKPCLVKGIVKRASLEVCSQAYYITSDIELQCARVKQHTIHCLFTCACMIGLQA